MSHPFTSFTILSSLPKIASVFYSNSAKDYVDYPPFSKMFLELLHFVGCDTS